MGEKDIVIRLENVTIAYKSIRAVSYRTFLKRIFKKGDPVRAGNRFEAVKNVSFEVYRGETLGIIGENGSGKSTLLGAIAGVYGVDNGTITINSDKCSLLALGVGFQSRLSGYQNIYLSGYAMGFTKQEIDDALDEIIAFSELGDFIYKPVTTYSSGMYSKLAFAISSVLTTDVLLIDEVLSVGDMRFQKKSLARMKEMIGDENRSVLIVNHSTSTLREICDRVAWLHKGELRMIGDKDEVLDAYETFMVGEKK